MKQQKRAGLGGRRWFCPLLPFGSVVISSHVAVVLYCVTAVNHRSPADSTSTSGRAAVGRFRAPSETPQSQLMGQSKTRATWQRWGKAVTLLSAEGDLKSTGIKEMKQHKCRKFRKVVIMKRFLFKMANINPKHGSKQVFMFMSCAHPLHLSVAYRTT